MSMLNSIQEGLEKFQSFDPSSMEDPLARQCSWSPVKPGGTNFGTHQLVKTSPERLEFKLKGGAVLFPVLFALIGFGLLLGMGIPGLLRMDFILLGMGVFMGGIFSLVGLLLFFSWTSPRIFDFSMGCYWKGRRTPNPYSNEWPKGSCRISDIHAVQIIRELCTSSSSSNGYRSTFYSYEINLVFQDGNRLNIIDHGNVDLILQDGNTLVQRLNVPLWRNF